jgi:hypothetical protein
MLSLLFIIPIGKHSGESVWAGTLREMPLHSCVAKEKAKACPKFKEGMSKEHDRKKVPKWEEISQ